MLIDFQRLNNSQGLNTTLAEIGILAEIGMADFNNLPFLTLVEQLGLGSEGSGPIEEKFPRQQDHLGKIDLSEDIQQLRENGKVADVIGPTRIPEGAVYFSTLLGTKLKGYLRQYTEVAKVLSARGTKFGVWLEDTLTALKNGWSTSTTRDAVKVYEAFFRKEVPGCQIMISSKTAGRGIPRSFAENLSAITIEEFLSALPFHRRHPLLVQVVDVVHFAWNCYVLSGLPGVHMTGITSKHLFQLFRKVVGKQNLTVVLLPLGSETELT